jgi:hypothetical protein
MANFAGYLKKRLLVLCLYVFECLCNDLWKSLACAQDPKKLDLSIVDSYDYNGHADRIIGSLPTNDWEVVESSGTNDFLNNLSEVHSGWRGFKQKASLFSRGCWLAAVFIPFMVFAFVLYFISTFLSAAWREHLQCVVWKMLRYCLERGGAAFIKWGQVFIFLCTQSWPSWATISNVPS